VELALADHGVVHLGPGIGRGDEGVELFLVEENDDGHDGDVLLLRAFEDGGFGCAGDQAVFVDFVPGGHEEIDMGGMGEEGTDGVGTVGHVEERYRRAVESGKSDETKENEGEESFLPERHLGLKVISQAKNIRRWCVSQ
jgi:hypothetical protein